MDGERLTRWHEDTEKYVGRGFKCELWGYKVEDMTDMADFTAIIGFLDELATDRNEKLEYWKQRCKRVEDRMDQLEREITRLKGGTPLTDKDIEEWNKQFDNR